MKERLMKIYQKHRILILYNLFGCLTVVVNYSVYCLLNIILNVSGGYLIAHIGAWVISVLFSYWGNKRFVFKPSTDRLRVAQFLSFVLIRVVTEVLTLAAMFLLVSVADFNSYWMKLLTDIVLVIINYVFTRYVSFSGLDEKIDDKRREHSAAVRERKEQKKHAEDQQ